MPLNIKKYLRVRQDPRCLSFVRSLQTPSEFLLGHRQISARGQAAWQWVSQDHGIVGGHLQVARAGRSHLTQNAARSQAVQVSDFGKVAPRTRTAEKLLHCLGHGRRANAESAACLRPKPRVSTTTNHTTCDTGVLVCTPSQSWCFFGCAPTPTARLCSQQTNAVALEVVCLIPR